MGNWVVIVNKTEKNKNWMSAKNEISHRLVCVCAKRTAYIILICICYQTDQKVSKNFFKKTFNQCINCSKVLIYRDKLTNCYWSSSANSDFKNWLSNAFLLVAKYSLIIVFAYFISGLSAKKN